MPPQLAKQNSRPVCKLRPGCAGLEVSGLRPDKTLFLPLSANRRLHDELSYDLKQTHTTHTPLQAYRARRRLSRATATQPALPSAEGIDKKRRALIRCCSTAIFLCLLLRRGLSIKFRFSLPVASRGSCGMPAAIRLGQLICLPFRVFIRLRGKSSSYEPSDLIPTWRGPSDLAFEAGPRGIAWRPWDNAGKRKNRKVCCAGHTKSQIIY